MKELRLIIPVRLVGADHSEIMDGNVDVGERGVEAGWKPGGQYPLAANERVVDGALRSVDAIAAAASPCAPGHEP